MHIWPCIKYMTWTTCMLHISLVHIKLFMIVDWPYMRHQTYDIFCPRCMHIYPYMEMSFLQMAFLDASLLPTRLTYVCFFRYNTGMSHDVHTGCLVHALSTRIHTQNASCCVNMQPRHAHHLRPCRTPCVASTCMCMQNTTHRHTPSVHMQPSRCLA